MKPLKGKHNRTRNPMVGDASTRLKAVSDLIHDIDYKELKQQKEILLKLRMKTNGKETSALDSILSLIDEIQDIAVDQYGYRENTVFYFTKEKQ